MAASPSEDRMTARVNTLIETDRLILRMFRDEDLDPYAAMCADVEVMRYLNDGCALDRQDAWRQMAMLAGHWALRGYGMWAVEERATGSFVGRVGLHRPEGWPGLEITWAIAPSFWGMGFASEAARTALREAFETMGADKVISLIHPDNARSIRVAERLGEKLEGRAEIRGTKVLLFGLART